MSEPLHISSTADKPEINLDSKANVFEILGKSLPEDAKSFYDPVITWFEEYANAPNEATVFNLKLNYFNSSSARKLVELLSVLEKIQEGGKEVKIVWHYKTYDTIMKERGEEVEMVLDVPFELKEY